MSELIGSYECPDCGARVTSGHRCFCKKIEMETNQDFQKFLKENYDKKGYPILEKGEQ